MKDWRELAIELFPEMRTMYENEDSIWNVFFDLYPITIQAHKEQNTEKLKAIYSFAEWCHKQKAENPELWDAAFAAFYEHLVDDPVTLEAIPEWVPEEVFQDMRDQFEKQLEKHPNRFRSLIERYNKIRDVKLH